MTAKGVNNDSKAWLSIDSLQHIARQYTKDTLQLPAKIDRLDIRPIKGIVKVVFTQHFTELQLDCAT